MNQYLLVALMFIAGCSCEEECDDLYSSCRDEGRSESICDKEKRSCKRRCDAASGGGDQGAIQE